MMVLKQTQSPPAVPPPLSPITLDTLILNHGDLIYDLCRSVLWSTQAANQALQVIFKELEFEIKKRDRQHFEDYELEWALNIVCRKLKKLFPKLARRLSPSEQIMLDSAAGADERIKYFESFFHLLPFDDQLLFLLTDKLNCSLDQAANTLLIPKDTLILKKALALRTLHDSLWPIQVGSKYTDNFMSLPCFKAFQRTMNYGLDSHCDQCNETIARIKTIFLNIAKLTKYSLPNSLRSMPLQLSFGANIKGAGTKGFTQRLVSNFWKKIPWWIRTGIESVGIAFTILFVVALLPKLRSIYENNIEKKLTSFNLAEFSQSVSSLDGESSQLSIPMARGRVGTSTTTINTDATAVDDDFVDDVAIHDEASNQHISNHEPLPEVSPNLSGPDVSAENSKIHVGQSEIWRFIIKTDSPYDMRPKIVNILTSLKAGLSPVSANGVEAPGGIQFDILVPSVTIPVLKTQLERLSLQNQGAETSSEVTADPNITAYSYGEVFTWYKRKSAKKIPPGRSRVVVWLSQM